MNKYYVINCYFADWRMKIPLNTNQKIVHINKREQLPIPPNNKIIPLDLKDRYLYNNDERAIFKMDIANVELLNNKCEFAKFMMEYFPDNIPTTISIWTNTIDYINPNYILGENRKMIKKTAIGFGGANVTIIQKLEKRENNFVISDYINHTEYYSGHFLIYKGDILKQIFFRGYNKNNPNLIRKGPITVYDILTKDNMVENVNVFGEIFKKINYSGFACPEFTIVDGKIKIFEINPRPGGSLLSNKHHCDDFFQKIIDMQIFD